MKTLHSYYVRLSFTLKFYARFGPKLTTYDYLFVNILTVIYICSTRTSYLEVIYEQDLTKMTREMHGITA